jgi:hypothetical protein
MSEVLRQLFYSGSIRSMLVVFGGQNQCMVTKIAKGRVARDSSCHVPESRRGIFLSRDAWHQRYICFCMAVSFNVTMHN